MTRDYPDWGTIATTPESELPTYVSLNDAVGAGPLVIHVMSLFNPFGSNVLAKIRRVVIAASCTGGTGVGQFVARLSRTTSLGTGPVGTPQPFDTDDPPSGLQLAIDLTVAPTLGPVLSNVSIWLERNTSVDLARLTDLTYFPPLYAHPPASQEKPIVLRPGGGAYVMFQLSGMDGYCMGSIIHTEQPLTPS